MSRRAGGGGTALRGWPPDALACLLACPGAAKDYPPRRGEVLATGRQGQARLCPRVLKVVMVPRSCPFPARGWNLMGTGALLLGKGEWMEMDPGEAGLSVKQMAASDKGQLG